MIRIFSIAAVAAVVTLSSVAVAGATGPHGGRGSRYSIAERAQHVESGERAYALTGSQARAAYGWTYELVRHPFDKGNLRRGHWLRVSAD